MFGSISRFGYNIAADFQQLKVGRYSQLIILSFASDFSKINAPTSLL